jgi:hypothetical protein
MMMFLAVLPDWEKQWQDKKASKIKTMFFIQLVILI